MKDNKLIAEFKDSLASLHQGKINIDVDVYEQAKYHTSWDWLMPVHKKCMFTPEFSGDDQLRTPLIDAVIDADIDRLYEAVVEFIKEHKSKDFDWCNDSGFSDVFDNNLCECTAPQIDEDVCICGRPISNTELKQ
jgi:hypothetical protein